MFGGGGGVKASKANFYTWGAGLLQNVHTCMHAHIHVCTCMYILLNVHTTMHAHTMYACACMHMHTYIYILI